MNLNTTDLSIQQKTFVKLYLNKYNGKGSLAYMEAYGETDEAAAASHASRLVRIGKVMKVIDDTLTKRFKKLDLTGDRILAELMAISFADNRDYYNDDGTLKNIHELNAVQQAAISSIETKEIFEKNEAGRDVFVGYEKKLKFHSKTKALEMLAKHKKLLNDSQQGGSKTDIHVYPTHQYIVRDLKQNGDEDATNQTNSLGHARESASGSFLDCTV